MLEYLPDLEKTNQEAKLNAGDVNCNHFRQEPPRNWNMSEASLAGAVIGRAAALADGENGCSEAYMEPEP